MNWKCVLIPASVVVVLTSEKVCVLRNFSTMCVFHLIKQNYYSEKFFRLFTKIFMFIYIYNYGCLAIIIELGEVCYEKRRKAGTEKFICR